MSTNQIMSKIEALLDWEKIMEEAKAEADALRDEIKQEMMVLHYKPEKLEQILRIVCSKKILELTLLAALEPFIIHAIGENGLHIL